MSLMLIKEIKDINRFRHILTILFEEGFDYIIKKFKLTGKIPFAKRLKARLKEKKILSNEKRLRITLERLGPTFIKFGQILSLRPDLIPLSYIEELEKLQDNVPPFSYELVQQTIEKELGKKIKTIFKKFEKKPIASASISQVHKAVLKNNDKVAVKIQRPYAKKIMERDIEIMLYFAKLLERHFPNIRHYSPVRIVNEFASWTEKELDFKKEAANAKIFYMNFKGIKYVKIPKVYDSYTTEKILVLEFIEGRELLKIKEQKKKKAEINEIIKNGFNAVLTQVFEHGFFHADPHPANILVLKNNSIAFVDFGIVGTFDEKLKEKSISIFYGIIENDIDLVSETLSEFSSDKDINISELKNEIYLIIKPFQKSSINELKVSHMLKEVMQVALNYKIILPLPFILFGKTIIILEGIALEYDPDFNTVKASKPFLERLYKKQTSPYYIFKNIKKTILKYKRFSETLPEDLNQALKRIRTGSIKVDIEDTDIKKLAVEIDKSSNRLSYALLSAAFLIVGTLLIQINFGPKIFKIPFLSILCFLASGILGIMLVLSILMEERNV